MTLSADPRVPLTSPCPCGSGRKYKRCCWPKEKRQAAEIRAQIQATPNLLGDYAMDFEEEIPDYSEYFFGPARERFGDEALDEFMEHAQVAVQVAFMDMFIADWVLRNGSTPLECFLEDEEESGALHPVVREYLEAWRDASIGLYEVQKVIPGDSMVLKDLLSRRSITVVERTATETLEQWDLLFTRVAAMGDEGLLTGPILPINRNHRQWLIDTLKEEKDRPGDRSLTWARFFKKNFELVPYLWFLLYVAPLDSLQLVNFDGEAIRDICVTYWLTAGGTAQAAARLDSMEELESHEPGQWAWVDEGEHGPVDNVTVAFLRLEGTCLELEVNSREREARVRERLDAVLGELVTHVDRSDEALDPRSTTWQDDPELLAEAEENEIPLELKKQLVHEMLEKHYRKWPDQEIPALDNLTPRQAAADPKYRKRLVDLLKDFESMSARHSPDDPMAGYDFGWLWNELGLRRP